MNKAIAIMVCAVLFSMIGLGTAWILLTKVWTAVRVVSEDEATVIVLAGPSIGAVAGMLIGGTAVILGSLLTRKK